MSDVLHRRTVIFVVRVWAEYLEQTPPLYRGEVLQPNSGQQRCFQDVAELLAFIQDQSAAAAREINQ